MSNTNPEYLTINQHIAPKVWRWCDTMADTDFILEEVTAVTLQGYHESNTGAITLKVYDCEGC
jgi:hypothetical protein